MSSTTSPDGVGDTGRQRIVDQLRVAPGPVPTWPGATPGGRAAVRTTTFLRTSSTPPRSRSSTTASSELKDAQELLWASNTYAVLVVFQAMDAAGKDSTIKHVMSGVNPQGVHVVSFKQPSSEELDHDFLWRISKALPARGQIGIFNRSQYEEVVALRVHPEWLDNQNLPPGERGPAFWAGRHEDLNAFERHLDRNGTKIVKFFLHVSKAEQKRRFMARLDNPNKLWKFSAGDVAVRAHWDEYMSAFEEAITRHFDRLGAVVRHPRRSQARDAGDGRPHPRRHDRITPARMADRLREGSSGERRGPSAARSRARLTPTTPAGPSRLSGRARPSG